MSKENALRALVATKQVEIDKLKRKIKELEYINDSLERLAEEDRINQGGWNGDNTRQRSVKTRKKTKRSSKSSNSNK